MRILRYVAGWTVVAAVVTLTAWQVVGAAASRVSEVPTAPLLADASIEISSSTGAASTVSTPPLSGTSTSSSSTSSTSTTFGGSSGTSPTSSTTTKPPLPSGSLSVPSPGGTVTVSYANGEVYLVGASPANGFSAEVEKQGPEEVKVEFKSGETEITVRVRYSDGQLVSEVDSHD